jgi:formylglycine-generating enzyme required for sulfatase activity
MADVFISYRNTPDRRAIVRRLATILRAYEVTVWWDYGLEAGESYRAQIMTELANARIVSPLWCAESVVSRWVRMEAEFGKDKLVPARLQKVTPPDAFEAIQAADLIGWDGAIGSPRAGAFVRRICERLGRRSVAPVDMIEELASLPPVLALPETALAAPTEASALARYGAEGRIKVDAKIIHGAPHGWFKPGAGKTEWFKDFDVGPEMVVVPAGSFTMGSVVPAGSFTTSPDRRDGERPPHEVTIKAPFAVGRFPVTFAEWDAEGPPFTPSDEGWGRRRRPVINVSWEDAKAHASLLSQMSGKDYRLLSEAEWEYCCRAGTTTAFWWGDTISTQQANYGGAKNGDYHMRTAPVGSFDPNPWGLYEVHGNVWEWCEDNWHDNYDGAPQDGSAWLGGGATSLRVVRGGSWLNGPGDLRSTSRSWARGSFHDGVGFRLARTL